MEDVLVGIDVGTTTCKAVVVGLDGRSVRVGSRPTPWHTTAFGTELAPAALLDAVLEALVESVAGLHVHVIAVGITGMGEAGVLLDRSGHPVSSIIAWHDLRDVQEFAALREDFGDRFSTTTGLPLWQQWSLTTHRWLIANHATAREASRRLGVPEWIAHALGGDMASEQSLASRTGWLDLARREWWPEALDWSGVTPAMLPDLVGPLESIGTVAPDHGAATAGAVIALAGHDHQAAAVGAGANAPGTVFNSCGTAEAFVASVPTGVDPSDVLALAQTGITVGWNVLPGYLCLLGATRGGLLLRRSLDLLGVDDYASQATLSGTALDAGATSIRVGGADSGVMTITGVTDGCRPADLWRAALEAASDAGQAMYEHLATAAGRPDVTVAAGGWVRDAAYMELKRRRLGEVRAVDAPEAGARGAALIAGVAAGAYDGPQDFPSPPLVGAG